MTIRLPLDALEPIDPSSGSEEFQEFIRLAPISWGELHHFAPDGLQAGQQRARDYMEREQDQNARC
jgi:hypothetical protein